MKRAIGFCLSFALLLSLCALAQVGGFDLARGFEWQRQAWNLPPSIAIYWGEAAASDGSPIAAWYADIDATNPNLQLRAFLSPSEKGKERASQMANRLGALVAINGGYFDVSSKPAKTYSLVLSEGRVIVPNIGRVSRPGRLYPVRRAAFGLKPDGTFDIAWIAHAPDGTPLRFDAPLPNSRTGAATEDLTGGTPWNVSEAIGAGPVLVRDGQIRVTYDEEVFFGSGFSNDLPYARAAVGFRPDGHLLFFTTDGKQPYHSVGLTLSQLAHEMLRLGCTQAMNLDGGGSETLVVNGVAINKPSDATGEREVTSVLAIVER